MLMISVTWWRRKKDAGSIPGNTFFLHDLHLFIVLYYHQSFTDKYVFRDLVLRIYSCVNLISGIIIKGNFLVRFLSFKELR